MSWTSWSISYSFDVELAMRTVVVVVVVVVVVAGPRFLQEADGLMVA